MKEPAGDSTPFPWVPIAALGLGYFALQVVWSLYNAYLPVLHGRFIASNTVIGLVMVIDNIFSVTFLPYFGSLSDRIDTRVGRRIPFLLLGVPVTAVTFALIPRMPSFLPLLAATLLMNLSLAVSSGASMALMPDVTPRIWRGRANGVLNATGGLGALAAFFIVSPLYRTRPVLPFDLTAILLLVALLVIVVAIRERRISLLYSGQVRASRDDQGAGGPAGAHLGAGHLLGVARDILVSHDRSARRLLLTGLLAVAAINGVQNMFTRYGVQFLGLDAPSATSLLGIFALAFLLFSIPAGFVGDRFGPLRTIQVGLAGTLAVFAAATVTRDPGAGPALFAFGGLSWAFMVVNAYPVLMNLTPPGQAGIYSSLWIAIIAAGGLLAPPIYGWIVDLFGFEAFFLPGVGFLALSLLSSFGVRSGETAGRRPVKHIGEAATGP